MLSFPSDAEIHWSEVKNQRLKKTRGVSFQNILEGRVIEIVVHPSREKQRIALIAYKQYIWVVPFIEQGRKVFLKTLYPSRKYTKSHGRRT